MTACPGKPPVDPGPTTTTTVPTPTPVVDDEPATHEKPAAMSVDGLKRGKCYNLHGDQNLQWSENGTSFGDAPTCDSSFGANQACSESGKVCKTSKGTYLTCQSKDPALFKCYGWVYENDPATHVDKPMAGVNLDIFWFAGCIAGSCKPMAGPVTTDQWGYFEIQSTALMDTLRINSPSGYYGVCNGQKPMAGGGTYITADPSPGVGHLNQPIGPFRQMKILPTSCK